MRPEVIATLAEGGTTIFFGICATLLGYRVIGKRPGESRKSDQWHERHGTAFQVLGPWIILFGLFQIVRGLVVASTPIFAEAELA